MTIVILGILATLAIPRMTGQQDAARAGEAVQTLSALHSAQLRFCLEHDCTGNNYPACGNLDVDIPPLTSFNNLVCANNGNISLDSTGIVYTLQVDAAGVFSCPGTCPPVVERIRPK
jgi:type II secretory pathway pseudopilin PulG